MTVAVFCIAPNFVTVAGGIVGVVDGGDGGSGRRCDRRVRDSFTRHDQRAVSTTTGGDASQTYTIYWHNIVSGMASWRIDGTSESRLASDGQNGRELALLCRCSMLANLRSIRASRCTRALFLSVYKLLCW